VKKILGYCKIFWKVSDFEYCSAWGKNERHVRCMRYYGRGDRKERDHFVDISTDGKII
jgi:hypothetical protein